MSSGPENRFRKVLQNALRSHFGRQVYLQKNHGSAYSAGLVDLEVVLQGQVGFYELKAGEGDFDPSCVTALQKVTLDAIDCAGGLAAVLYYDLTSRTVVRYNARSLWVPSPVGSFAASLTTATTDSRVMRAILALWADSLGRSL